MWIIKPSTDFNAVTRLLNEVFAQIIDYDGPGELSAQLLEIFDAPSTSMPIEVAMLSVESVLDERFGRV